MPDLSLTLDETSLSLASLGIERAMNPGSHRFHGEAPGHEAADVEFSVGEGERVDDAIRLVLKPLSNAESKGVTPEDSGDADGGGLWKPETRETIGYVTLGVGALGLAAGGVFTALAIGKRNELEDGCIGTACPPSQADTLDSYHQHANLATVSFIAGGVLAGTGIILLVTEIGDIETESASIRPYLGLGSVGAIGTF
jgi:hypothetical protein